MIKTNFEEKVLKTGVVALVDLWAPWCIAPNTLISRDLGQAVLAKNIKKDDELINYKNGLSNDKVSYSKMIKDGGHCRKIKTERGRQIETTDDHLFYTDEGWKTGKDLQIGDRVAVFPGLEPIFTAKNRNILVNEKDIVKVAGRRMLIKRYIKELKEKKLLPLRMNNDKLLILARLCGFLFTDGTLYQQRTNNYREISFCLGEKKDVEAIIKDLNILGFKGHVNEKQSFQEIEGRKFTARTKGIKCLSTSLWLLFKTLGVPDGKKTNQAYNLPGWLLKAPKDIKREFLAGFLGGDGPKLLMHESFRKRKKSF
ncbi:MAG: hypothetical protein Q8N15_06080, partial [Bacillota bacterium]|nr:hypothetical protein [Bacillota bacterium]